MTRTWSATDATHWVSDTMMEQFGNLANYNVVDGCGASYSGTDLVVTIAAGTVTHNGVQIAVAGNTVTLVADATNPRFTWIAINSSGVAEIVSGTAAADPTEPELGDRVEIALVKVTAGATVASSLDAADRRLFAPTTADTDAAGLTADVNSAASTTLGDITGLSASLAANGTYAFRALVHYTAAAAADYKFGITVPSGAALHAMCVYMNTSNTGTISSITSSGGSINANGFGASTPGVIAVFGSIMGTYSAGDLQFQQAHVAVSGTVTTKSKSRIELF